MTTITSAVFPVMFLAASFPAAAGAAPPSAQARQRRASALQQQVTKLAS